MGEQNEKNVLVTQGTKDAPTGARPENGRLTTKWGGVPSNMCSFFAGANEPLLISIVWFFFFHFSRISSKWEQSRVVGSYFIFSRCHGRCDGRPAATALGRLVSIVVDY